MVAAAILAAVVTLADVRTEAAATLKAARTAAVTIMVMATATVDRVSALELALGRTSMADHIITVMRRAIATRPATTISTAIGSRIRAATNTESKSICG